MRRAAKWLVGGTLCLVALVIATLFLPVALWRTGRQPVAPLDLVRGEAPMPQRIWIDTDAACGAGRADPDDCWAIALLAREREVEIVGISTVFGNAPRDVTDRITRQLIAAIAPTIPVHTGAAEARDTAASDAVTALRGALAEGPLTILTLGPLTNVAASLAGQPDLARNVAGIVAVMGRRPGHIFHPTEGSGGHAARPRPRVPRSHSRLRSACRRGRADDAPAAHAHPL